MKRVAAVFSSVLLALSLLMPPASAADNFTPSVTAKFAPEVVVEENADNKKIAAKIVDENKKVLNELEDQVEIIITPVADILNEKTKDSVPDDISIKLKNAYNEILNANKISDLCDDLDDVIEKIDSGHTPEQYVVRDLFDIDISDEHLQKINQPGNALVVTFDVGIKPDDIIIVVADCGDKGWLIVEMDNVTNNGDGTVTVKFTELCPIAFATASDNSPGTVSPPTYDITLSLIILMCVFAAIAVIIIKRRKSSSRV